MTPGESQNEWYHYYCSNFYVLNVIGWNKQVKVISYSTAEKSSTEHLDTIIFHFMWKQDPCAYSEGGGGGAGGPDPPWKITKLSSQHSMLGHYWLASQKPFKWRFAGGLMMARLNWILSLPSSAKNKKKNVVKDGHPLTKFSGSVHGYQPYRNNLSLQKSLHANIWQNMSYFTLVTIDFRRSKVNFRRTSVVLRK